MSRHIGIVNSPICFGGAEKVLTTLANELIERGYKVSLLTFDRQEAEDAFEIDARVARVHLLDRTSQNKFLTVWRFVVIMARLRSYVKKSKMHSIIGFQEKNSIYMLLSLCCLFRPVKKIVAVRNHPAHKKLPLLLRCLRRLLFPTASGIVVQTLEVKKFYEHYSSFPPIVVIPNILTIIDTEKAPRITLKKPAIVTVGRCVKQKGFDKLISSFYELSKQFPQWSLYIVGDGDCRQQLEQKVMEYDISSSVHFTGFLNKPYDIVQQADIFTLTSEHEGYPNVLCEAMALGVPAVSFDCPSGPSDIINNKESGLLVENGCIESLVRALRIMMSDNELRRECSVNGRKIRGRLSAEEIIPLWERLFDK